MRARLAFPVLGLVLSAAAVVVIAPAASAHPPGTHNRVVEAEPAVVYIETSTTAQVVLHDMGKPVFLQLKTYDEPPLASGNGIVVNQTGTIVTAASVVTPDLTRARIYAANRIFADYYKIRVPGDPFVRHTLADPTANSNLQNCYDTHEMYMKGATCVVSLTTKVRVFPFVTSPTSGGLPADVLRPAGPAGVAVLAINTSNTPTAALAPALGRTAPVSTIGFTDRPAAASKPVTADEHLTPPGTPRFTAADLATVQKAMGSKAAGVPVISADTGAVVGLVSGAPDGSLIPAERITAALQSLGIRPTRTPVDTTFAEATAFFLDQHYAHAVPRLQEVLRLDPQNAPAAQMLQVALAKRGTAADKSNQGMGAMTTSGAMSSHRAGGGVSGWLIVLYVALGLLALAVVATFMFGRRLTGRGAIFRRRGGPNAPATSAVVAVPDSPAVSGDRKPASASGASGSVPQPRGGGQDASLTMPRPRVSVPSSADAMRRVPATGSGSARQRPASAPSTGMVAQRQFCTDCGAQLAPHHRFCGMCGTGVE